MSAPTQTARVQIATFGKTDTGQRRQENQDAFLVADLSLAGSAATGVNVRPLGSVVPTVLPFRAGPIEGPTHFSQFFIAHFINLSPAFLTAPLNIVALTGRTTGKN